MSAKDGHISPEGENSLLGRREVQGALSLSLVRSLGRTGSRSPSGTRVSPRFGGGWCGALGDRELFYFAKVPFPPCGLYLVSRQAGHVLPRALKAASVVVSSRGRPSRSHLGGGFPAGWLAAASSKVDLPACSLSPRPAWPWSDDVASLLAGAVESQGEAGEIKQSPISALFP